jgi:hypothetical protein
VKNRACLISLRRLAQSLITILVLISPLSFSTDKVSNFTYECPVSTTCTITTSRRITQQRQFTATLKPPVSSPTCSHTLSAPLIPAVDQHRFPSHCRAPPA